MPTHPSNPQESRSPAAEGQNLTSRWRSFKGKLPLSALLVLPFILQIAVAVGLVTWLSYRNGQKAVNELATELREELIARTEQQIQTYVETPHIINKINANMFSRNDLRVSEVRGEYQLWQQARIFPATNLIYCGSEETGELMGVGRSLTERQLHLVLYNQSTGNVAHYYSLDENGNPVRLLRRGNDKYDARLRPWYRSAKADGGATWSEIYLDFDTQLPTITASLPAYDLSGNLLGVCGTDFLLSVELNRFLSQLEVGQSGEVFVIEESGLLVASSAAKPLVSGTELDQLPSAVDSENMLIRETALSLVDRFGSLAAISQTQQLDMQIEGKRHFVQIAPFQDGRGLDWTIVVVVPESDFMAQIQANTRNTLILSGVALAIAVGIGFLVVRWLTGRIQLVCDRAEAIAAGDLNQPIGRSRIIEVDKLANSFNLMEERLQGSFTKLEHRNKELVSTNDALRIAEETYRSIYQNALEGIFQSSPEGRYLSVNPTMATIYGYESSEEMVESITDIATQIYVDPDDRLHFKECLEQEDCLKKFEYRAYKKDSTIIWVQEDTRAVRDHQGKLLYYEGIVQDISDRKRREEELRRQLAELKIEIDQKKRRQEVAAITQSNYFQELQEELSDVDADSFWS